MTIAFYGNVPVNEVTPQGLPQIKLTKEQQSIFENIKEISSVLNSDAFEKTNKKEAEAPKISLPRILFCRLKQDQVNAVNESRKLPKNAKLKENGLGGMYLTFNICDFTQGTHTLPAGYELKNDILGFTHIVREGTQAWYLKK